MHDNILIVLDLHTYDRAMHIAILTFEGYNELDSLIAFGILNRIRKADWRVSIASPQPASPLDERFGHRFPHLA